MVQSPNETLYRVGNNWVEMIEQPNPNSNKLLSWNKFSPNCTVFKIFQDSELIDSFYIDVCSKRWDQEDMDQKYRKAVSISTNKSFAVFIEHRIITLGAKPSSNTDNPKIQKLQQLLSKIKQ